MGVKICADREAFPTNPPVSEPDRLFWQLRPQSGLAHHKTSQPSFFLNARLLKMSNKLLIKLGGPIAVYKLNTKSIVDCVDAFYSKKNCCRPKSKDFVCLFCSRRVMFSPKTNVQKSRSSVKATKNT